jgi:hypothetical protein
MESLKRLALDRQIRSARQEQTQGGQTTIPMCFVCYGYTSLPLPFFAGRAPQGNGRWLKTPADWPRSAVAWHAGAMHKAGESA